MFLSALQGKHLSPPRRRAAVRFAWGRIQPCSHGFPAVWSSALSVAFPWQNHALNCQGNKREEVVRGILTVVINVLLTLFQLGQASARTASIKNVTSALQVLHSACQISTSEDFL